MMDTGGMDVTSVLLTAISGAIAGAISMFAGEFVATKSQNEVMRGVSLCFSMCMISVIICNKDKSLVLILRNHAHFVRKSNLNKATLQTTTHKKCKNSPLF